MTENITIKCNIDEINRLSSLIEKLGENVNFTPQTTMGISLTVEEIVTAYVKSKYADCESPIDICAELTTDKLVLDISAKGLSLEPSDFLANQMTKDNDLMSKLLAYKVMDSMEYRYEDGVNHLRFVKNRPVADSESTLKVNLCRVDNVVVLDIEGRLDTDNSRNFAELIEPLLTEPHLNLIINCELMSYICSSGLRSFLMLQKSVKRNKGAMVIEAMPQPIKHVFDMTGCLPLFTFR